MRQFGRFQVILITWLVVVGGMFATPGLAATGAKEKARVKYQAGQYEAAVKAADQALKKTPDDAPLYLLKGLALNRLNRHEEALTSLEKAQALGLVYEGLLFELGWAFMGAQQPKRAIVMLESFEKVNPGVGQTAEFLGRCYFALGQYDDAEIYFNEAIKRDAELKTTTNLYLSEIARRGGQPDAVERYARDVAKSDPSSPVGQQITDLLEADESRLRRGDPNKRWRVTVSVGGGYNDNVAGLSSDIATPATLPDRDGGFARVTFLGSYDILRDKDQIATAGYGLQGDFHGGEQDDVNLLDHYFYFDYARRVADKTTAGIRFSDDYLQLGGDSFRNRFSTRPYVLFQLDEWLACEVGYTFHVTDYFFNTVARTDRDDLGHAIDATFFIAPKGSPVRGRVGITQQWSDADGSDFDHRSFTLFAGVDFPLMWDMTGSLLYVHTWRDFDNPNLLGTGASREDESNTVRVQLTRPIDLGIPGDAKLYFMYEHVFNESNVALYEYRQNVYSAGVIINF